jgi:hypothetical protein
MANLTKTQREALLAAKERGDARLRHTSSRGGSGHRMMQELVERGLLAGAGQNWRVGHFGPFTITDAGLAALTA